MSFSFYQCIKTGFRRFFLLFVSVAPFAWAQTQLPNLTNSAPAARFAITDRVWASNPGDASICLWEDDKLAALSISVDDNSAANINWWMDKADTYGFKMTWFVITGIVGDSNPNMHGTWAVYSNVLARGHDVQSHSVTHENTEAEYQNSQIAIETNLPGHKCNFIAYPGGTTYPLDPVAAAKYYASARGTGGSINAANKIAYMNVNATSTPNLTNAAASWAYLPNLFVTNDLRYYRGWSVQIFHWVSDYSINAQPLLDFYDAHRADLWCGRYGDVAKYGQERDTATLTVTTNTADLIAMTLTDQMMDSLFNYPLTIKVRLPASWGALQATQNGQAISSSLIETNGARYALVQAVPDQGLIELVQDASVEFSVSPSSGWVPLTVTFTDTSTLTGITNRYWNFGDGATTNTTAAMVTHTYTSAGTNTVQLIAGGSDGAGTNTQAAAVIVTVPVAPSAGFSVSPSSGTLPLAVTFTDSSTGDITNRFWDFGDGLTTNITGAGTIHTYTSAGTNTVRLIVSGPAGISTNTQAAAVTVNAPVAPSAAFSVSPASGTASLAVTFTDLSTGSITNRLWNFGDGATTNTTATSVAHTYVSAGTYSVSLIVSGPAGVSTNTQSSAVSVAASSGGGALLIYDSFSDAVELNSSVLSSMPSTWSTTSAIPNSARPYDNHSQITAGSLSYAGLQTSEGNKWTTHQGSDDYYKDVSGLSGLVTGDTVYYSFLLKVDPSDAASQYYIRLYNTANIFSSGLAFSFGLSTDLSKIGFSLSNRNNNFSQAESSSLTHTGYDYNSSDTFLIVMGYQRGTTAANSAMRLWVNPDSATFGTATPPTATLTLPGYNYTQEAIWNKIEYNFNGSGTGTVNGESIDEFRVATDWAHAVPADTPISGGTDDDNDGIPNEWEMQYFGGLTNANPNAMAANGINTIYETYIAGLNPTNPASAFSVSNDWNTLRWDAVSGRVYSVYWTTNLLGGFQCLETNIVWPQNSWTGQASQAEGFYFLEVRQAP